MTTTSIEWTATINSDGTITKGRVWNPVTGCTKVSQGCKHCYAETIANRFWSRQYPPNPDGSPRRFTDVRCHPERLNEPLKWKMPARVFVNSMSDLFHPDVPDLFIRQVFTVMGMAHQHTFQILTKRPQRMQEFIANLVSEMDFFDDRWRGEGEAKNYFPNVWLGVSVENQQAADERIPLLLQTPAAVRFISAEPLLGPILLDNGSNSWLTCDGSNQSGIDGEHVCCESYAVHGDHFHGIDWVIVGGESGHGARPMHPDWARSLRDQCQAAEVKLFVKQMGGHPDKRARLEDLPEDLRIREFPEVNGVA